MPPSSVLIVEDDRSIRETMKMILELNGYSVYTAGDGREALTILKSIRPSLILLDLMMPLMNGWQFLNELKKLDQTSSVPVVIVSAAGNAVAASQELGKELLLKPLKLETFLQVVKRYSERDQAHRESLERKYG